jgi:hypothetical protein
VKVCKIYVILSSRNILDLKLSENVK